MIRNSDNQALFPAESGEIDAGAEAKSRAMFLERMAGVGFQYRATSGLAASVVIQDITYTAVATGFDADPDIEITYLDDGSAGAETVSVTDSSIVVHMEDAVSTATQIRAAILASAPALALVTPVISGTASDAQDDQNATGLTADEVAGSLYREVSDAFSPEGENELPAENEWSRDADPLEDFDGSVAVNYADEFDTKHRWARLVFVSANDSPASEHSGRYQTKE